MKDRSATVRITVKRQRLPKAEWAARLHAVEKAVAESQAATVIDWQKLRTVFDV